MAIPGLIFRWLVAKIDRFNTGNFVIHYGDVTTQPKNVSTLSLLVPGDQIGTSHYIPKCHSIDRRRRDQRFAAELKYLVKS